MDCIYPIVPSSKALQNLPLIYPFTVTHICGSTRQIKMVALPKSTLTCEQKEPGTEPLIRWQTLFSLSHSSLRQAYLHLITCSMLFVEATHPTSLPPPSSSFIPLHSLPRIHSFLSIRPILSFPTYPHTIPNIQVIFSLRFHMTNLVQHPPCFPHPHGYLSSLCIYSSSTPECYLYMGSSSGTSL